MERFISSGDCIALPRRPTPTTLRMHDGSRAVAKLKPKVKIVHVFEPEIMKTDAANFRELVQRLTGKPAPAAICSSKKKEKKRNSTKVVTLFPNKMINHDEYSSPVCDEVATRSEVVKKETSEEERTMTVANNSGGFLGEFEEVDFFLQELIDLPLSSALCCD
ncbi:VQ motif-containing protein 17 [Canna indica]|uniref:VQ motif-containing protein 17 n=1 Tax=Canna indica TaxID=4628 RepID=A0AAQ3QLH2_9LILI|nr:VQ motif-containing protein 17 [Canna indica]